METKGKLYCHQVQTQIELFKPKQQEAVGICKHKLENIYSLFLMTFKNII